MKTAMLGFRDHGVIDLGLGGVVMYMGVSKIQGP